jgi:hypothetical protein
MIIVYCCPDILNIKQNGTLYRSGIAANGIPLGAEVNPKNFKVILFDHGIFQRILGLELSSYLTERDFSTIKLDFQNQPHTSSSPPG